MPPVPKREARFALVNDDCRKALRKMRSNSVDAVVTDPPYHLTSGKKGGPGGGFMGKKWDGGDVAFDPATWAAVLRVLKPGGHLLAFGGSRTFHRIAVGIEDGGFELRDTIMWIFGSGFPKSLDVSKAIDKAAGANRLPGKPGRWAGREAAPSDTESWRLRHERAREDTTPATDAARQWDGWGTALKPAFEPIIVARKPLAGTVAANVLLHGVGGLNIDGCRIPTGDDMDRGVRRTALGRMNDDGWVPKEMIAPGNPIGRWPANVVHDGSDEVLEAFAVAGKKGGGVGRDKGEGVPNATVYADVGTAARFFYCAKSSKSDRDSGLGEFEDQESAAMQGNLVSGQPLAGNGTPIKTPIRKNPHPTVKPQALMRWLVRLVTPPGGLVLDPFAGSGSTGVAAAAEGFRFLGMESDVEHGYFPILTARVSAAYART